MSKSLCTYCKHKDECNTVVRLYGIPNMRVTECKAYEKEGADDGEMA
jgi:hypothetical protein